MYIGPKPKERRGSMWKIIYVREEPHNHRYVVWVVSMISGLGSLSPSPYKLNGIPKLTAMMFYYENACHCSVTYSKATIILSVLFYNFFVSGIKSANSILKLTRSGLNLKNLVIHHKWHNNNDKNVGVVDFYSCTNGCVLLLKGFVLPDKQYNRYWSHVVFIKALIVRRSRSVSF